MILTPEGVRFGLPLAGPITRLVAWLVDVLAIAAISSGTLKVVSVLALINRDWTSALATLCYFVISAGYGIAFERLWNGQTPGKHVMGLRVIDARGLKLTFSQVVIRNLLRAVDALPLLYFVGGAAMLLTRDAQRLGDLAAGTAVVRLGSLSPLIAAPLAAGKYNSLLDYPHLVQRLRQKTPPELVELAAQALARRDELLPESRFVVFEELASRFLLVASFPEDALHGLTGEQIVRNSVNAILQAGARGSRAKLAIGV